MKNMYIAVAAAIMASSAAMASDYPEKSLPGKFQNTVAPTVMNAPAKEPAKEAAPAKEEKKAVKRSPKGAKKPDAKKAR